jgi:hypothetical protein
MSSKFGVDEEGLGGRTDKELERLRIGITVEL